MGKVSRRHGGEVSVRLKDVFSALDKKQARLRLKALAERADAIKAGLGDYVERTVQDGFGVFAVPVQMRRALSTTNMPITACPVEA